MRKQKLCYEKNYTDISVIVYHENKILYCEIYKCFVIRKSNFILNIVVIYYESKLAYYETEKLHYEKNYTDISVVVY